MEKINFKNEEEFMEMTKSSKPAHRATLGGGGQNHFLSVRKRLLAKIFGVNKLKPCKKDKKILKQVQDDKLTQDKKTLKRVQDDILPQAIVGEGNNIKRAAFTLAEVLITLGIIGVVAAMTIPSLMTAYKKHLVESRLKQSYSLLTQAVRLSQVDNGEPSGWDFTQGVVGYVNTYIKPYIKADTKVIGHANHHYLNAYSLQLHNGVVFKITLYTVYTEIYHYHCLIQVDINGDAKPNVTGLDRFNFYIFPDARRFYNTGEGNCALNVPSAGVYYDGYGFSDAELLNNQWRGCGKGKTSDTIESTNGFCTGLIVRNGWKIPKDYPLKF